MSNVRNGSLRYIVLISLVGAGATGCVPKKAPAAVKITAPAQGAFETVSQVTFDGVIRRSGSQALSMTVNGNPVSAEFEGPNSSLFHAQYDLTADDVDIFHTAVASVSLGGTTLRDATTIIEGDSITEDEHATDGLGLRVNESALAALAMAIEDSGNLRLAALLPPGEEINGSTTVIQARSDRESLRITSKTNRLKLRYTMYDLDMDLYKEGIDDCDIELWMDRALIDATVRVRAAANGTIDIDLDDVDVDTDDFDYDLDNCPLGSIIDGLGADIGGQIEDQFVNGVEDFVSEDALEDYLDALSDLDIGAAIGNEIGLTVSAPLTAVVEDGSGVTFRADVQVLAPQVAYGAPDLVESYALAETFPTYSDTMSDGTPYGLALGLSATALNHALRAATENGFLQETIDFGGAALDVLPALAPIVSGQAGPNGEPFDVHLGHLQLSARDVVTGDTLWKVLVGGRAGLDLAYDVEQGGFVVDIAAAVDDLLVDVLENHTAASDTSIAATAKLAVNFALPSLGASLGVVELPSIEFKRDGKIKSKLGFVGLPTSREDTYATAHADAEAVLCVNADGDLKPSGGYVQCWQDQDNDGFPIGSAEAVTAFACGGDCPDGWASQPPEAVGADCADRHPGANPAHTQFEALPHDNGYDWNCDGVEEKFHKTIDCLADFGGGLICAGTWSLGAVPACGGDLICTAFCPGPGGIPLEMPPVDMGKQRCR